MSQMRIYIEANLEPGKTLTIPEEELHHIKVRRVKKGESIFIVNGKGTEAIGVLKEDCVEVVEISHPLDRELPVKVHLFIAILKRDKMELVIQKATELGVYRIVPVILERSIPKITADKVKRWQKIAVEAIKQSGRVLLPVVESPVTVEKLQPAGKTLLLWEKATRHIGEDLKEIHPEISVIVGPEGGITKKEVEILLSKGAVPVSVGKTILKAETAAIYALSVVRYLSMSTPL